MGRKKKEYGLYDTNNADLLKGFFTTQEIAEITGKSESYIKWCIVRSRKVDFDGSVLVADKYEIAEIKEELC